MALKKKSQVADPRDAARAHREQLVAAGAAFKAHRPAREALRPVVAVPTCLVQLDHGTSVGGLPVERFMLAHGPSGEGKTKFTLAMAGSFLARDHAVHLVDAERTTPLPFAEEVMGAELANHPLFHAERPESYESTIKSVRAWLSTLTNLRTNKKVHPQTCGLVIIDSIRKLIPKDQLDGIMRDIESEAKAARAGKVLKDLSQRIAQRKAAMNAAWMDELVPLLERAQAGCLVIAREMLDPDAGTWARKAGTDYKVGGGGAIYYDASLVFRVERAAYVYAKKHDQLKEREQNPIYGERHRLTIRKTKVAGHEGRVTVCHFHSSNGVHVPKGLDRARDLVELGTTLGAVQRAKAWVAWRRKRWASEHAAVKALSADPAMLAELDADVRARFADRPADDCDPATGEVS